MLALIAGFEIVAVPLMGLFYAFYSHLPAALSFAWRLTLGGSFAVATLGLGIAWLLFLAFRLRFGSR
jgi:hypothetical protein